MVYVQLFAENEGDRGEIAQLAVSGRNRAGTDPTTDVTAIASARFRCAHRGARPTDPEFSPTCQRDNAEPMGQAFDAFRQHVDRGILAKARRNIASR